MRYLNLTEAAEALQLSVPTVKRYIYDGKLRSSKLPGGQHRIAETEISRLLNAEDAEMAAEPEAEPEQRVAVLERWVTELESEVERLAAALQVVSSYCAQKCTGGGQAAAAGLQGAHRIAVLGPGCRKCVALGELVTRLVRETGRGDIAVEQVTNLDDIAAYGPILTPALAIDGEIAMSGRVPTEAALRALLARHVG